MCKVSLIRSVSYQLLQRWNEINEHNAPEMVSDTQEAPSIHSLSKYFLIIGSSSSFLFTPFAMWICLSSSEVECTWPALDCVGSSMRLAWANGLFAEWCRNLTCVCPVELAPLSTSFLLERGRTCSGQVLDQGGWETHGADPTYSMNPRPADSQMQE